MSVFARLMAALALAVLAPLLALLALLVVAVDGHPVLYRGVRLGRGRRPFTMYKFRTMADGAENRIGGRLMRGEDGVVTPLGRILRYLKFDELPQLWNVVRGDMGFVGPRPVRPAMADDYSAHVPGYDARFAVRPGLTGLAQIRGGYYCPPARKTRYDCFYIARRGISMDVWLLYRTATYMAASVLRLKIRKVPEPRG